MKRDKQSERLISNHWATPSCIDGIDDMATDEMRGAILHSNKDVWDHFDPSSDIISFVTTRDISPYSWGCMSLVVNRIASARYHNEQPHTIAIKPSRYDGEEFAPHLDAVRDTGGYRLINASGWPVKIFVPGSNDAVSIPSTSALNPALFADIWSEMQCSARWCIVLTQALLPSAIDEHDPDFAPSQTWKCLFKPREHLSSPEACIRRAIISFIRSALRAGAPSNLRLTVAEVV